MFEPLIKYQEHEIAQMAQQKPIINQQRDYTSLSVLVDNVQYSFLSFAFANGDALFLVAVDGYMPHLTPIEADLLRSEERGNSSKSARTLINSPVAKTQAA